MWNRCLIVVLVCVAGGGSDVRAAPRDATVTVGTAALLFRHGHATDFSLQYRFGSFGRWQPQLIGTWSTDGSRFIGTGLLLHLTPAKAWDVAIGFAPGYYEREHGPRLGSSLEFLSTLEVSRALAHGRRFGIALGHISNGSLGDRNPGAETIRVFWTMPLGR